MSAVIIEHVDIAALPQRWRAKLPAPQTVRVAGAAALRVRALSSPVRKPAATKAKSS